VAKPLALIVEDHMHMARILAEAAKAAGYETETALTGDAALERLSELVPDLVILDLQLPNVPGGEILHKIRTFGRFKDTQVIVVTAYAHKGDELEKKADLVLLKPIRFEQLRDLISRLRLESPSQEAGADPTKTDA
jgi:CheY-like chemotaxis protein